MSPYLFDLPFTDYINYRSKIIKTISTASTKNHNFIIGKNKNQRLVISPKEPTSEI
jgi:hypothetical protein